MASSLKSLGYGLSKRWVAGANISDAIAVAKKFNAKGVKALLTHMDISLTKPKDVEHSVDEIKELIDAIVESGVDAEISIRASQLGMMAEKQVMKLAMKFHYKRIVEYAKERNIFVWLDMESEQHVGDVIALYKTMVKSKNTGICLQTALERTKTDIKQLVYYGAAIRLVKGAYMHHGAMKSIERTKMTNGFIVMMNYLFENSKNRFVIGTHDPVIINRALEMQRKFKRKDMMFGMLYGIRNAYAVSMAGGGHAIEEFIPYGKHYVKFGVVRLSVMHNVELVLSSFFEDQRI